jgi:hypothetical protein
MPKFAILAKYKNEAKSFQSRQKNFMLRDEENLSHAKGPEDLVVFLQYLESITDWLNYVRVTYFMYFSSHTLLGFAAQQYESVFLITIRLRYVYPK